MPPCPGAAVAIWADGLPVAERYADWLATTGMTAGLIGPRELPLLWERHLLNSAVVAELTPRHGRLADVGSGAGLPGIPVAIRRPGLRVDLVEPLGRRAEPVARLLADLGLADRVRVRRQRAEDLAATVARGELQPYDVVTARAVASLPQLLRWCLPLLAPGGRLLAVKGRRAGDEVRESIGDLRQSGAEAWEVRTAAWPAASEAVVTATVVEVVAGAEPGRIARPTSKRKS